MVRLRNLNKEYKVDKVDILNGDQKQVDVAREDHQRVGKTT